jgi:DNA invertase Pin-like site-specific DNA recombinase
VNVIGYVRVSTDDQAASGLGLDAQRATIAGEAAKRGWSVTWVEDAGHSAKTLKRPGVTTALNLLAKGEAQVLVVAKLDRLSRSVQDFAATMDTARKQGWALVALDLGVDTTTPAGELVANVMAAVAQWERRVISDRTKDALAAAQARGTRLGRPRAIDAGLLLRIVGLRYDAGLSLRQIATVLNDEGMPTVRGGRCWHPATIRGLLHSHLLDQPAEAETDQSTTKKCRAV